MGTGSDGRVMERDPYTIRAVGLKEAQAILERRGLVMADSHPNYTVTGNFPNGDLPCVTEGMVLQRRGDTSATFYTRTPWRIRIILSEAAVIEERCLIEVVKKKEEVVVKVEAIPGYQDKPMILGDPQGGLMPCPMEHLESLPCRGWVVQREEVRRALKDSQVYLRSTRDTKDERKAKVEQVTQKKAERKAAAMERKEAEKEQVMVAAEKKSHLPFRALRLVREAVKKEKRKLKKAEQERKRDNTVKTEPFPTLDPSAQVSLDHGIFCILSDAGAPFVTPLTDYANQCSPCPQS